MSSNKVDQARIRDLERQLQSKDRKDMVEQRQVQRERNKRLQEGSGANIEITDKQGQLVYKIFPHNIVANVLMLGYAGLTAWAASAGTSTYTRLLDVEYPKYSQKLADLENLQPARMACSFFFGMGLGIFVAFIASVVEMANHKRVRQALFIILMAVPVIVLGLIGVNGSKNVCSMNPGGKCAVNACQSNNQCILQPSQTCTYDPSKTDVTGTGCQENTCKDGVCHLDGSTCKGDKSVQSNVGATLSPNRKRKAYMPESSSKFPRLSKFWKSLTGTHESDLADNLFDDDSTSTDEADDVLRFNVRASDYLFIGLGCGVLVAGLFTILPDNPFHPSKFDTKFQEERQKAFHTVSQVNPTWWAYALVFSLVMAGGGASSMILTQTPVQKFTDPNGRDVRKSGQMQSIIAVVASVVMFVAILLLGMVHLNRQKKLGKLVQQYENSSTSAPVAGAFSKRS
jgi:uncharacterized membrane protein YidH (DUF202 family)